MFFRHGRAGRLTVARLFTLALLAGAATACGAPLRVPDLTATANSRDGIVIEPVVSTSPTLASSLLADLPPLVPNAEAAATPQALSPPSATPAPAATSTVTTTPEATSTPRPGQTPVTPGAGTATPATTMTPPTTLTLVARTATPGTTATVTSVQAATVSGGDMGAQTVAALNAYRAQQGLPALRTSGTLTLAASNYAKLMADRNYFGHDGPDGSSPSGRMAAAGYGGRFKG
ncbi:MAG TPA: CAP domain-containing protein, partial [Dehalococcoidia bacterium]